MGTVYRKTVTKALPAGAEIFIRKGERFARWKDAKGKLRTAPLTTGREGQERIVITAATFTAKYRDGGRIVREVPTGCRDEVAARSILADLERRAQLVKGKVITAAEDAISDHQSTPLAIHFTAYTAHRKAKGLNAVRIKNTTARLDRLAADCKFRQLADLTASALESWLSDRAAKMSPGNRNEFRQELIGFGNWCVRTKRLLNNPFASVAKADAKADQRRKRRSMTEAELERLLAVARSRPLAEYGREVARKEADKVKRKRDTWKRTPLEFASLETAIAAARKRLAKNPGFVAKLEALGRERALIYKTLLLTGLRKAELASLTVGQVHLDGDFPFLALDAADEKNRQGSQLPLRGDLATDLELWIKSKQESAYRVAGVASNGHSAAVIPMTRQPEPIPASMPLFTVPAGLVRILDRDLKAAGIAKRDERGRTLDVHALRHTFGTLLSKGGVAPRTAQAAMRHSTIDLTMNVYTDPKLLDVQGALESLPALPLSSEPRFTTEVARATGTDDLRQNPFAPAFAPTPYNSSQKGSFPVKSTPEAKERIAQTRLDASSFPVKDKHPLPTADNGCWKVEATERQLNCLFVESCRGRMQSESCVLRHRIEREPEAQLQMARTRVQIPEYCGTL